VRVYVRGQSGEREREGAILRSVCWCLGVLVCVCVYENIVVFVYMCASVRVCMCVCGCLCSRVLVCE